MSEVKWVQTMSKLNCWNDYILDLYHHIQIFPPPPPKKNPFKCTSIPIFWLAVLKLALMFQQQNFSILIYIDIKSMNTLTFRLSECYSIYNALKLRKHAFHLAVQMSMLHCHIQSMKALSSQNKRLSTLQCMLFHLPHVMSLSWIFHESYQGRSWIPRNMLKCKSSCLFLEVPRNSCVYCEKLGLRFVTGTLASLAS